MNKSVKEWDELLVKAAGIALVTVALTWLPEALGAVAQIVSIAVQQPMVPTGDSSLQELHTKLYVQLMSVAVGKIVAFLILLVLARWMFGYPKIIRRALQRTSQQHSKADTEQ